jgi:hypothetical protein
MRSLVSARSEFRPFQSDHCVGRLCKISKSNRFTIREAVCISFFAPKMYVRELDELFRLAYKESVEKDSARRLDLNHASEAHSHGFTFLFSPMKWPRPGHDEASESVFVRESPFKTRNLHPFILREKCLMWKYLNVFLSENFEVDGAVKSILFYI